MNMKKSLFLTIALLLTIVARAQTLNVKVGSVTYQFPATQTGEMNFTDGSSLTIMGKTFTLADIDAMTVDESEVTDGAIAVSYNGTSASVKVAGNVAQYVTPVVDGAHVPKQYVHQAGLWLEQRQRHAGDDDPGEEVRQVEQCL